MFGNFVQRLATPTIGTVLGNVGSSILGKVATAGIRKVDQFLGLDEAPQQQPAVAVSNMENRQNTIETDMSGSENIFGGLPDRIQPGYSVSDRQQAQISTVLPAVRAVGRNVVPFVRRNIGAITGIGGTAAMLSDLYTEQGLCSPSRGGKPYSISKTTGCISVTRKQQRMMKELVMTVGMDEASAALGLDASQIGLLLVKKFPQRSRGISGASMKTTRRTIRQLTRYAHDLDEFCKRPTPTRRRRTK